MLGRSDFSSALEVEVVANACNDALATQRLIALVLLGPGVGARIAIPIVASAVRD